MHGYKTLLLCLVLGICYFVGGYLVGQGEAVVGNAGWFVAAIAGLYTGNDVGGALRDRARQQEDPS